MNLELHDIHDVQAPFEDSVVRNECAAHRLNPPLFFELSSSADAARLLDRFDRLPPRAEAGIILQMAWCPSSLYPTTPSILGGRLDEQGLTESLIRATDGSRSDAEKLFHDVYAELRRMAERELRKERRDHSLQPTELVHEAFFKLVDRTRCRFEDRKHFLGVACRAMRQVLIDQARRRNRDKRGGGWGRIPLEELPLAAKRDIDTTLLALNEALERLMARHPEKARIVEMHFFVGFTFEECAEILGVSLRTVSRHWAFAQAWLARELTQD